MNKIVTSFGTLNRLTASRKELGAGVRMKDVKGLTKEHLCTTHGHGQQFGDWHGEGPGGWAWEVWKGRKSGNYCKSINNKNK